METGSWTPCRFIAESFRTARLMFSKGILVETLCTVAAIGIACAAGKSLHGRDHSGPAGAEAIPIPPAGTLANRGYTLFMQNCAHCHGADARGDEGPDLHDVRKSDERITTIIQNGIKGEMPKFSAKLSAEDTRALVAFLRAL